MDEESEPEWSVKIPTRSVSSLIAAQQVPTVLHDASNHSLQSSFSVTASTENSSQSASLASENISDLTLEGPPGSVQCTGHIQHHNLSEQEISSIVRHLDKLPDTLSSSLPVPSLHEDSEVNSLSPEAENPEAPAKFPTQIDSEECRQSPAQELLIPVTPSRSGELPSSASQSTDTKLVPLSQSDTRIDGTSIESHPPIDSSSVDQVRQVIPSSETASFGSSFFSSVTDSFAKLGNVFYELETSLDSKMDTAATEDESQKGSENGAIAPKESVGVLHLSVQAIFLFDLVLADEIRLSLQIYYVDKSGKKVLFRKPLTRLVNSWTYREKISLSVPHFRAVVLLEVIDVVTERIYGRSKLTAYQVKHRADDSRVNASVYGSSNKSILLLDDKAKSKLGRIDCDLSFEEDLYNHFWSPLVRYCPTSPEEELSIDRLGVHMVRFRAMIDFFNQCFTEYLLIMNWSDPVLTSTLFLLFIYCTIYVKPDYSMSGILFICVLLMTRSWYRRKNGKFRDKYLKPYLADAVAPYHPVATLKIAVLGHHKVVNSTRTIPSLGFSFLSATNDAAHNQIAAFKVTMIPDKAFLNSDVSVDSNSNTSSASAAPAVPTKELPVGVFSTSEDYSRAIGESSGVTQFVNSLIKSEQAKSEFLANTFDPWPLMDRSVFSSFTQHCVEFVQASTAEIGLIYPLLQPVKRKQDLVKEKGSASSSSTIATALTSSSDSLETAKDLSHTTSPGAKRKKFEGRTAETNHAFYSTWTTSTSAVKVSLVQPPTSAFSDYHADEYVLLPIRDILLHGEQVDQGGLYFEYTGWLRCVQTMSKDGNEKVQFVIFYGCFRLIVILFLRLQREFDLRSLDNSLSKVSLDLSGSARNASLTPITSSSGQNEVLIRASIKLPSVRRLASPTADEKKVSQVLQELLFGRGDKESTTFSVLWNMRDYVKYAQNLMSWILDYFESAKNLFNWTSPQRTFLLYVSLVGLWILTILIPGRILVFIAGLFQFLYIFLPIPEGNELSIWTHNLLQSIPNDDDLMEIYADDRRLVNEAETEKRRREVRDVLLNVSIPVAWAQEAQVKVLRRGGNSSGSAISSSGSIGAVEWVTVFLVVQGHRLAWWTTESDLDKSKVGCMVSRIRE